MTATLGAIWTPGPLTEQQRMKNMKWLAGEWGWLGLEKWQLLDEWKPSGVSDGRMAQIREVLEVADDLRDRTVRWQERYPELTGVDPQETAIELAADEAKACLYELVNGEQH